MRWIAVLTPVLALNACIYYEGGPGCDTCGWDDWDDTGDTGWDDDVDDTATPGDTDDDLLEVDLFLAPGEGAQGDALIVSLQSSDLELDLSKVESVQFYGDVAVHAAEAREDEVLLSIAVADEALLGPVDLLVEFVDGSAAFAEEAFLVTEGAPDPSTDPECP